MRAATRAADGIILNLETGALFVGHAPAALENSDLVLQIFSFLERASRARAAGTCKLFRHVADAATLWVHLVVDGDVSEGEAAYIASRAAHVRAVTVKYIDQQDHCCLGDVVARLEDDVRVTFACEPGEEDSSVYVTDPRIWQSGRCTFLREVSFDCSVSPTIIRSARFTAVVAQLLLCSRGRNVTIGFGELDTVPPGASPEETRELAQEMHTQIRFWSDALWDSQRQFYCSFWTDGDTNWWVYNSPEPPAVIS